MTKRMLGIVLAALSVTCLTLAAPAAAGTIKGKVKPLGLRTAGNILVYLVKAPAGKLDLSAAKFVMDQRRLTFIPQVLPVPVGAAVRFPNNDKVNHNVFSLSKTKKFNLGSYPPGASKTVVFDRPGAVELRCDVHQEMGAYIMVLKNPYFAVTDAQGNFSIPDPRYLAARGLKGVPPLPAGKYLLKVWHPKLRTARKRVSVPAAGAVQVEIKARRGAPGALYKR